MQPKRSLRHRRCMTVMTMRGEMRAASADSGADEAVRYAHRLYDEQYVTLVAQLHALCGDRGEAEDAVQEAFVKALLKPQRFAALDNPAAWLRTVAVNHVRGRW